ncbi:glutamate 5-kinase [Candidatus Peregrinibacteria bacterium]|nr:glutamate 5-kinase [Candidatus Peregrinibacteria bacterium]
MKTKRIIIKVGTNSISNSDGTINKNVIKHLVEQIAKLSKDYNILIITSGAVGTGRSLIKEKFYDDITNKQVYAAVGQVELMKIYSNFFKKHKKIIAQILATKADFSNREHYLNMKNCLESLFNEGIIPIMNENDVVATDELMFTDNDELAALIAKMMTVDLLVLLTNVDGVYDKNKKVIKCFGCNDKTPNHILSKDKSVFGRGGMQSKFKMAQVAAKSGVEVCIANSRELNGIMRIVKGESIGTKFTRKKS